MKRLLLMLCLVFWVFPVGCGIRERNLDEYQAAQQARREATVERFMTTYGDQWQQKLREYDEAVERARLSEEALRLQRVREGRD